MTTSNDQRDIEFGEPATYRIVVQGTLAENWSDRLAGLTITASGPGDGAPRTTLEGPLRDQAELNGVLDTLYGLQLSILEVKTLDEEPESNSSTTRVRQVP